MCKSADGEACSKRFLPNQGVSLLFLRVILAFGVKYDGKLMLSALDFYGIEIYV